MHGGTATTGTFGGRLFAPGLDGAGVPATGLWRFCRNKVEELELRWHLPSNQKAKL